MRPIVREMSPGISVVVNFLDARAFRRIKVSTPKRGFLSVVPLRLDPSPLLLWEF